MSRRPRRVTQSDFKYQGRLLAADMRVADAAEAKRRPLDDKIKLLLAMYQSSPKPKEKS